MKCAQCLNEYSPDFAFCPQCGWPLPRLCSYCGAVLARDFTFCPQCGRRVQVAAAQAAGQPDAPPPGPESALRRFIPKGYADRLLATAGPVEPERRQVTILFSDVKGSTALAERLDPEDVVEIMNGAFGILIEPICRDEGTLARLMGDAILAFFGAPIAHEDDTERAIRAALEIQARVREYAAKLARERGIEGFKGILITHDT